MLRLARYASLLLLFVLVSNTIFAFATTNSVAPSGASVTDVPLDFGPAVPPECAGMRFDNIITEHSSTYQWSGITVYVFEGTNGNDLIIGGDTADDLLGQNGRDCLVSGDGWDYVIGGNGKDVLIGGAGDDVLDGGNGTDACYGNGGNDSFISCSTQGRAESDSSEAEQPSGAPVRPHTGP